MSQRRSATVTHSQSGYRVKPFQTSVVTNFVEPTWKLKTKKMKIRRAETEEALKIARNSVMGSFDTDVAFSILHAVGKAASAASGNVLGADLLSAVLRQSQPTPLPQGMSYVADGGAVKMVTDEEFIEALAKRIEVPAEHPFVARLNNPQKANEKLREMMQMSDEI